MKKIISILVVVVLLAVGICAAIPASAATSYSVRWNELDYVTYNHNSVQVANSTFEGKFTLTKTADTLGANRHTADSTSYSYISTTQFAITTTTNYVYEVMVKTNSNNKYGGVPFAINSSGEVYFAYGSFNNSNDTGESWNPNKSYIITAKGDFDNKYPSPSDELKDTAYFQTLLQTDGYASLRFEYSGLTVKVYAKNSSGTYVQMGYNVNLPTGSKLCFGIFSRDGENNQNRTVTIKNAVITGNNAESEGYMGTIDNTGRGELRDLISQVEAECVQSNYTPESWTVYANALANAKVAVDDQNATTSSISNAKIALEDAYFGLEAAEVDTTELEAAIATAEALKEVEYTNITWNLFATALDNAKETLDAARAETVNQSAVDEALDNLNTKMRNLQPSGITETEAPATEAPATEAPATEAPATEAPATEAPATEAPATEAPATEAPATEAPATEAPATEAPATEAPATEAPATEAPATEAPATEAPATEAPATESPATEAPATEAPATEAPATEASDVEAKGCGGAVATTAVVVGLVATLGTAIVVKKKED